MGIIVNFSIVWLETRSSNQGRFCITLWRQVAFDDSLFFLYCLLRSFSILSTDTHQVACCLDKKCVDASGMLWNAAIRRTNKLPNASVRWRQNQRQATTKTGKQHVDKDNTSTRTSPKRHWDKPTKKGKKLMMKMLPENHPLLLVWKWACHLQNI